MSVNYGASFGKPDSKLEKLYDMEQLRLECVLTCVSFDEILDVALTANHPHFDTIIVVTSHDDHLTQSVCRKHGAICVQTDLFKKNGRLFNKGAAINAGFNRFQYHGWRAQLDADIILPDNFRRMLFNNSHLERSCLYGADRMDVIGREEMKAVFDYRHPQHTEGVFLHPKHPRALSPRYVDKLHGYVPLGYFGLWHASTQKPYPYSLGDASHDDIAFGILWPESCRRLLPSALLYHLCSEPPKLGQNWEKRTSKRLDDA